MLSCTKAVGFLSTTACLALGALQVDFNSPASIKAAAALAAEDLLSFYRGDEPGFVPGILPGPPPDGDYYWWIGGAMWGTLIDYMAWTGDDKYTEITRTALVFQAGQDRDYLPANWSASMGNDDQAFWALSAMLAAEQGFKDPPKEEPQYLALVQAVFNQQTSLDRRAPSGDICEWGLRWQVYPHNNGYNYINTIANACYFNLGARLARYTDNDTYGELANKTWDFMRRVNYIDDDYHVYDGAHVPGCTDLQKAEFSYNAAMLIQGAAFLYNRTSSPAWKERVEGLLGTIIPTFFPDGIAVELPCEGHGTCNADMTSFKGFLHRWLATTAQLVPSTATTIMPVLKKSTEAAVKQCTGGTNGRMCGFLWSTGTFDGKVGANKQMNVVAALSSLLILDSKALVTNKTGGTSTGDVNAGQTKSTVRELTPVTVGDRVGASIVTILLLGLGGGAFWFMST